MLVMCILVLDEEDLGSSPGAAINLSCLFVLSHARLCASRSAIAFVEDYVDIFAKAARSVSTRLCDQDLRVPVFIKPAASMRPAGIAGWRERSRFKSGCRYTCTFCFL